MPFSRVGRVENSCVTQQELILREGFVNLSERYFDDSETSEDNRHGIKAGPHA